MMKNKTVPSSNQKKVIWITRTAIFIALLVVMQFLTASLGNTIITGSIVNLLLIVCVMTCGLSAGICVSAISPIIAKLLGIGPFWELIPFIIAGNIVLVLLWHLIGNYPMKNKLVPSILALIIGAIGKFATLYFGIVQFAVPIILRLQGEQAVIISAMFSVPQLITALIGGTVAIVILASLKKYLKYSE